MGNAAKAMSRISTRRSQIAARGGGTPALMIACAVGLLALPSAVLAFSARFDVQSANQLPGDGVGALGSGKLDPQLSRAIATRPENGGLFRFTPAGTETRPDRSVNVAVRVDTATANAITVRGVLPAPRAAAPGIAAVHIAPTAYNLGVAPAARSAPVSLGLGADIRRIDMPDLSAFKPGDPTGSSAPSRFAPRVATGDREKPGRAPRTFDGSGDQTVDFGGSYRLSRNIDVTAGVRYSQDRERLAPARPDGRQDSQAVYVGTQFRF
jgi:hypothetical protein